MVHRFKALGLPNLEVVLVAIVHAQHVSCPLKDLERGSVRCGVGPERRLRAGRVDEPEEPGVRAVAMGHSHHDGNVAVIAEVPDAVQ